MSYTLYSTNSLLYNAFYVCVCVCVWFVCCVYVYAIKTVNPNVVNNVFIKTNYIMSKTMSKIHVTIYLYDRMMIAQF